MTYDYENTKIRAINAPWYGGIEILIKQGDHYVKNIEMVRIPDGAIVEPSLRLDYEEAQLLMDDLWHSGVRPSEGIGNAGQLKATEKHLEDMRTLVFKKG